MCNRLSRGRLPWYGFSKAIGVVFGGFLLSLGLSTVAHAEMFDRGQGGCSSLVTCKCARWRAVSQQPIKSSKAKWSALRAMTVFFKGQDGKEVRLHIDTTTQKARNIEPVSILKLR